MLRVHREPVAKTVATLIIGIKARTGLVLRYFLRGGGPIATLYIYKQVASLWISIR